MRWSLAGAPADPLLLLRRASARRRLGDMIAARDDAAYAVDYRWNAGVTVPRNPSETILFTSVPEPGFGASIGLGLATLALRAARRRSEPRRSA